MLLTTSTIGVAEPHRPFLRRDSDIARFNHAREVRLHLNVHRDETRE